MTTYIITADNKPAIDFLEKLSAINKALIAKLEVKNREYIERDYSLSCQIEML